jgi:hypothetical protein
MIPRINTKKLYEHLHSKAFYNFSQRKIDAIEPVKKRNNMIQFQKQSTSHFTPLIFGIVKNLE